MEVLRQIPRSWFALLIILLIFCYLCFNAVGNAIKDLQVRREHGELQRQVRALEYRHEQLNAVESYLRSDEYVEMTARRILGYRRPGEWMAIVTAPEGQRLQEPPRVPGSAWWESLFIP